MENKQNLRNGEDTDTGVSMTKIKELIPAHCFEKNLFISLSYLVCDMLLLSTSFYTWSFVKNNFKFLLYILFVNFYGFMLYCVFLIGHDCGHTTFSNYPVINAICGHLSNSISMVPFWPWAYSHSQHHVYHHHISKDFSFDWFTKESWQLNEKKFGKWLIKIYLSPIFPFFGWYMYLYTNYGDGNHFSPFSRLFDNVRNLKQRYVERIKCLFSSLSVIVFLYYFISAVGAYNFVVAYLPCCGVFSCWAYMTTYMQHHDEFSQTGTIVMDDSTFTFLDGALQTIDRRIALDAMVHHITSGHLVHHLYFTKIPHYHLMEATYAIRGYLMQKSKYKFTDLSNEYLFLYFCKMYKKTHFVATLKSKKK